MTIYILIYISIFFINIKNFFKREYVKNDG